MPRFIVFIAAVALGTAAACAQDASHARSKHQKTAPAVQAADTPNDIAAVPRNVQKWFGGAVDDILTGADKAIDPGKGKR